jgi:sugar-specific transcriptional regulator TrmB
MPDPAYDGGNSGRVAVVAETVVPADGVRRPDVDGAGLDDETSSSFAALGLDTHTVRVYQQTLMLDTWSPDDLARSLSLPGEVVASALDVLVDKGLLVPSQETSGTLRSVDPRVGLNRLIDERDRTLRLAQERLAQTRTATRQLVDLVDGHETRQRSSLEQVSGRDLVADRVSELLAQATSEVLTVLTVLPNPDALASARRGDALLLERGVQTRLLVLAGHVRRSHDYLAYLDELVGLGAEVRVLPTLPTRMIVVDHSAAILPSDPDNPGAGATIVRHHALIQLMRDTFETLWREGGHLGGGAGTSEGWEPSELELEVIRLLGRGNKDEAIARRVGMSLRSVRRLISQVSTELGSGSRFELGMICASRGWVEPPAAP